MKFLLITAILGILISAYAYYVEVMIKKVKNYIAFCDLSDRASCTKAFSSKYGKIGGISNSLLGIIFYIFILILIFTKVELVFYFAVLSFIGSIYLAYLSLIKLKNLCIICNLIYLINILLVIFSYFRI